MTYGEGLTGIWERRLSECRSALDVDRDYAWFYRIRIKVLEYLIGRYGGEALDVPPPAPRRDPEIFLPPDRPRPLKSRESLRAVLRQISDAGSGPRFG